MEKLSYDTLDENLFHKKLNNGLEVYLLPKNEFNKTFATFTTKYGSIDNNFVPINKNQSIQVPDGIAHFLEHKLFEKEDEDVFQKFSQQGASANAFTSFTRTCYLFSSTNNIYKNLETLINFVQEPYFSEQSVEKEKGIIAQEIKMYDDNPDWKAYFGTIESLYESLPIRIDIAGTIESIGKIDKELLYECYNTFYHPSNMLLFVTGPFDENEMMKFIEENQTRKDFKEVSPVKRNFADEPIEVKEKDKIVSFFVQTPKVMIGIKNNSVNKKGKDWIKSEQSKNIILDLIFGSHTSNHYEMYQSGLIDDTFSYDYTEEASYGFGIIGGDTKYPDKLQEKIKTLLIESKNKDWDYKELETLKRRKIGVFLNSLNSPEYIANQFTRYAFMEANLFDTMEVLNNLTLEDIKQSINELINEQSMSTCKILPK
ncbi:MAG: peptidase inactive domain protein [Bacillales bacterium]|jgi:predicted Zn-dependent peptidase|nr:peptidase inactive domain protein [Bacillales bacterium]